MSRLLGVRQHQLAIQSLLREAQDEGEAFVETTLLGELGVSKEDYQAMADRILDQAMQRRRALERLRVLVEAAGLAAEGLDPGWVPDQPAMLRWVRAAAALEAYASAAARLGVELAAPRSTVDAFGAERARWRVAAVCVAIRVSETPENGYLAVKRSFGSLRLADAPASARLDPDAGARVLEPALASFLDAHGSPHPAPGETPAQFLKREAPGWQSRVFQEGEDLSGARARFLPIVVALAAGADIGRGRVAMLAEAYAELPSHASLTELRADIEAFLAAHGDLAPEEIVSWLAQFPHLPTRPEPDALPSVKSILEALKQSQDDRLARKVEEYRTRLAALVDPLEGEERDAALLGEEPDLPEPPPEEPDADPDEPVAQDPASPPPKPKPTPMGEGDEEQDPFTKYQVKAERNALTGRRGEAFARMCVLHRWEQLAARDSATAKERLLELFDAWAEVPEARKEALLAAPPTIWTSAPELREHLEALIQVGGTSMDNDRLGYDLLSLSRDGARLQRVEVKSTTGRTQEAFLVTDNELRAATAYAAGYEVWHVRGVRRGRHVKLPLLKVYSHPARLIEKRMLVTESVVRQVRPYKAPKKA